MAASLMPDRPSRLERLSNRLLGWRDRLLASPRFQRFAASFPLTRPVSEARARALFDIVAGFVYSQVLASCVQLRVFQTLASGPQSIATLAPRLGLSIEAARCLLEAAVTLDLISKRGPDRYGLGSLGAAFLGNPGLADMVAHHALFYADMADPVALLSDRHAPGHLQSFWAYARAADPASLGREDVAAYSDLMGASQAFVADDILDAVPLGKVTTLMDVGGGDGSFLLSVARRHPHLELMLVDLPAVAERADARFAAAGLQPRAKAHGRDFLSQPLPTGADAISLVRVVHDHHDAAVTTLLRAAYAALPPGGLVIIAEPMADTPGAQRMGAAYFNFYLRAMGSGRSRSAHELQGILQSAGFVSVKSVRTRRPLLTSVLVARRPD